REMIGVEEGGEFGGHVDVDARVDQPQTGVHEIGLPLDLVAAQGGKQTIWTDQFRAGLSQPDFLLIPETEFAAGEIRTVHDRVEALSRPVARVRSTGSVEP